MLSSAGLIGFGLRVSAENVTRPKSKLAEMAALPKPQRSDALASFIEANRSSGDPRVQDEVAAARIRLAYASAERKDFGAARQTLLTAAEQYQGKGEIGEDFGGLADQARYQAICCLVGEGKTHQARQEFRDFLREHPLSPLCQAAHRRLARLNGGQSDPLDDQLLDAAVQAQTEYVRRETAMCGPKVLRLLLEAERMPAPDVHALAKLAHSTKDGASMEGLRNAARASGIELYGYSLTGKDLQRLSGPAILLQGEHYLLLKSAKAGTAIAFDTLRNRDIDFKIPAQTTVHWLVLSPELLLNLGQPTPVSEKP